MRFARTGPWLAAAAVVFVAYTMGPMRAGSRTSGADASTRAGDRHPMKFFDERTFSLALLRNPPASTPSGRSVRAIVIPHHWLAADLIVQGLGGLANDRIRRVVLIGPNHIGAGGATFATSRLPWQVPGGSIAADIEAVDDLVRRAGARLLPDVLSHEHSVAGLVPAVAHFFPNAGVVPIAVHARPTPFELEDMTKELAELLGEPDSVLVASVDFSHYRSAAEAVGRNSESIRALESFDVGRILGFGNEHMDSPATIALLLETMRLVGATRFTLWGDTNSSKFGGPSTAPNVTSYVTGCFS